MELFGDNEGIHFFVRSFGSAFFYAERKKIMDIYKELYYKLFNDVTGLIEKAKEIQTDAEEMYLKMSETKTVEEVWHEMTGFYENYCPEGQDTMFE